MFPFKFPARLARALPKSIRGYGKVAVDDCSKSISSGNAIEFALKNKPVNTWTKAEIGEIYNHHSLIELVYLAQQQHRKYHDFTKVQLCTLFNIKEGGCTEDCKYCAQSTRYQTGVKAEKMISVSEVVEAAKEAKANGSTRFCLGSAWREMKGRKSALGRIGEMVKEINNLGMESCVTLGMIDQQQLDFLKSKGLTAYNHNIDTSREHYPKVISTRSYEDRLKTIDNVTKSGVSLCTGGILGLGETEEDHISFLYTLATLPEHPESLPINRLVKIAGTPLEKAREIKFEEILRTVATARLVMPGLIIRLAAGRYTMKEQEQFLCFMAGVNAIFTGKRMLTTMCNGWEDDKKMLSKWGITGVGRSQEVYSNKP